MAISRLTDKLIDEVIDDDAFKSKKAEILMAKQKWLNSQKKFVKISDKRQKQERFLELAKNLYFTYLAAAKDQKREIVNLVSSNRKIIGKSLEIEPSNWLLGMERSLNLECCAPSSPASRTKISEKDIDALLGKVENLKPKLEDPTNCQF